MTSRAGHTDGGRIGLALAGGGPVGAVYEIGALRALEEAVVGIDFTALHVYVGVSAGSFVAAFLANGVTPSQLVRVLDGREDGDPLLPAIFFTPAYWEWFRRALQLPRLTWEAVQAVIERPDIFRAMSRFAGAIPTALFDNEPIRRALAEAFTRQGRTDDFRKLRRHLIVVATDLGAGEPIRFGEPGLDDVPISRAIQASTALPGVYPPVHVAQRYCVDGVLLKTVHASVAFDAGAKLVLCINPIVPVDTTAGVRAGVLPVGSLLAGGFPALMSQTFRTLVHSRLQAGFSSYEGRYPDSDFILFEPDRDEYRMFFSNVFSLASRRAVCELAYQATRRSLRLRADRLEPVFAKYGCELKRDVLEGRDRTVWHDTPRFTAEFRARRAVEPRRRLRVPNAGAGDGVLERLTRALDAVEKQAGG
ncbi:MAG: patatin-like phospholipase family protein [Gemmatimonadota bacterium]|nr:patatin-like phospholipase family protein [Gemmatimonadota bacterium]